jgi:hypothetical protein
MEQLRDLEADQQRLEDFHCDLKSVGLSIGCQQEALEIAAAVLDEIDQLKRLLVKPWPHEGPTGKIGFIVPRHVFPVLAPENGVMFGTEFVWFPDDTTAWAAVRKAAIKCHAIQRTIGGRCGRMNARRAREPAASIAADSHRGVNRSMCLALIARRRK